MGGFRGWDFYRGMRGKTPSGVYVGLEQYADRIPCVGYEHTHSGDLQVDKMVPE